MRSITILIGAMLLLVTAPGALASHEDPTHGVAPHTVSNDPTNIHPVDISTPHPYPRGQTFTWTVEVDDAESLSVHFERYDVNGRESRRGGCSGSTVTISDADSGAVLDEICGNSPRSDDFWTPFYDTNHLEIQLDSNRGFGDNYGFDVYEVASDGTIPIASVPYSEQARADSESETKAEPDPFVPSESVVRIFTSFEASYAATEAEGSGQVGIGEYLDCSTFFCREKDGNRVHAAGSAAVGTLTIDAEGGVIVEEDSQSNIGYSVTPQASCDVDGTRCPSP